MSGSLFSLRMQGVALFSVLTFCNPLMAQQAPAESQPATTVPDGMCFTQDNNQFDLARGDVYRNGKIKIKFNGWQNVVANYHENRKTYTVAGGTLQLETNLAFVQNTVLDPVYIRSQHWEWPAIDSKGTTDLCPGVEIELVCSSNELPANEPDAYGLHCKLTQF